MKKSASPCSDQQLQVLLTDSEDSAAFHVASEHIECCSDCQSRLTVLAAADEDWKDIRESLSASDFVRKIEGEYTDRPWNAVEHLQPPASWSDAVAQQLLSPPSHPEMLGRLGRYEIERLIGSGGMGIVFKAFDSELNRPVAVKVLSPHLAGSGAARKRFAREARAAAAVVHEHVVAIHNVESDGEPPFLVMHYVAGESLQERLNQQGPLGVREVLRIASQTAAGLAAAHKQGLVHRDVKPSNILLEEGVERALLTDFGLARASDDASLTQSGQIPGTPHYMSPEQARGEHTDYRSDLFSLGSVMYAMCTGRMPFRAETSYGVLRRITDDTPAPVSDINSEMPGWMNSIVSGLMRKQPEERFASADDVASLLADCLAHVQQPASVKLPEGLPRESLRMRLPRLAEPPKAVTAGLIAAVFAFCGLLFLQMTNSPDVSGDWHGEEWGQVVLKKSAQQRYSGTYTDINGTKRGDIELTWSRIERRYNGRWHEAGDRFGDISLRLVDGEVRGAWTTSRDSLINPGTPALAEFVWKRGRSVMPTPEQSPGPEPIASNSPDGNEFNNAQNFSFYPGSVDRSPPPSWQSLDDEIQKLVRESDEVSARAQQAWGQPAAGE